MKLSDLLNMDDSRQIESLMVDSREEVKNGIFFCVEGLTVDGHQYIQQAIKNGAVAIVHSKNVVKESSVAYYQTDDVVAVMHDVANKFYNFPSKKMYVHGITGTNGKSTVMKTVRDILENFGVKTGYIGTISIEYDGKILEPSLTTPDILELNYHLSKMCEAGVEEVCLEVSSQGLGLRRVEGIEFDEGSFTNLSHDHLDYHKTMENYFEAKMILFESLNQHSKIFVNTDDPYGKRLLQRFPSQVVSFGIENKEVDYRAKDIYLFKDHSEFILEHKGNKYPVWTNYRAYFNIYNLLNVIAILHHRGYAIERIVAELANLKGVEGRITLIDEGQNFDVYVDFGHAPESMKNVYSFVRSTLKPQNKIITVFGAAGARDHLKRPIMGKVSTSMCDWVIFTEHDNRDEEVKTITHDIMQGVVSDNYEFIPTRLKAIEKAIEYANPGDAVVIIGKGEEKFIYRDFGREYWMGDDEACRLAIRKKMKGEKNEL